MALTARREKFAQAVAGGKTPTDAYREAFTVGKMANRTLWSKASAMHAVDSVRARINELRGKVEEASIYTMQQIRDVVLRDAMEVAAADPSDLITHRRLNCRYCHGVGHAYRWRDEAEFWGELARVSAIRETWEAKRGKPPELPTDEGGYGWRRLNPPAQDCPKCEGEGVEDVRVADIRTLSGPARRLYAGVKVKKDGSIEVLTRNKDAAAMLLARHAGMITEKVQHSGAVGLYPMPMTDEQRAKVLKAIEDDI